MMDIMDLLKRLEFADNGRYCKICGFPNHDHKDGYMDGPCPLKLLIDDFASGRLVVIENGGKG